MTPVKLPAIQRNVNESTPLDQRTPEARSPEGTGPIVGEKGEYKPALYPTRSGAKREDR